MELLLDSWTSAMRLMWLLFDIETRSSALALQLTEREAEDATDAFS